MKILFYGAKDYDQQFFDKLRPEYPDIEFVFIESNLYKETASLAAGYDGICAFVNADLSADVIEELKTVCWCGDGASCNTRFNEKGEIIREGAQVFLGANDDYVALCRRHYKAGNLGPRIRK